RGLRAFLQGELPVPGRRRARRPRSPLESVQRIGPAIPGRHSKRGLLSADLPDLPGPGIRGFSSRLAALSPGGIRHEGRGGSAAGGAVAELFHGVQLPGVRRIDRSLGERSNTLLLGALLYAGTL